MSKVIIEELEHAWHVNFNGSVEYDDEETQKEFELGYLVQSAYALFSFIETNYDVEQDNILLGIDTLRQYREKYGIADSFGIRTEEGD